MWSRTRLARPVLVPALGVAALLAPALPIPGLPAGARSAAGDPPAQSAPAQAEPDVLERFDGSLVEGRVVSLAGGAFLVETAGGEGSVLLDDFVLLSRPLPAALPPEADVLVLAGGEDRLVGRVVGGDAYGLRFELAAGPVVELSFESVDRILPRVVLPLDRLGLLAGGGADDRLWRRRPDGGFDALSGVVDRVEGRRLVFEGALGELAFELDEIVAVVLAAGEAPAPAADGLPVTLALGDGSRFRAGLLGWQEHRVRVATGWAGPLELPAAAVGSIVRRARGARLLAELRPAEVDEVPALAELGETLFPWRSELSVTGLPLSVGGRARASGLGVHARSRLVFAPPPGARELRVTVGLADETAAIVAAGSVSFELLVDGAARARSGLLREGDAPRVLRVDGLGGVRRVELLVTDGGDDDAGDRAAWVDGVFLLDERDG